MPEVIDSFRGKYAFLSNFYRCWVVYGKNVFLSVEAAYQAAKSNDPDDWLTFSKITDPAKAKRMGRHVQLCPNWDEMRTDVMRRCLASKFRSDLILKGKLIGTYPAKLIEGNDWGDTFWGICAGRGINILGRLLMELRYTLIQESMVNK